MPGGFSTSARAMEQAGVDVQCVGGNVPGRFPRPERPTTASSCPSSESTSKFLQQNGTPAMYHNCGQVMNLVESYRGPWRAGGRALLRRRRSATPTLPASRRSSAGRYVILSGIDQVNVLRGGSIDRVKRATEQAILAGKPGGGFVLQPVDFLEHGTPIENVEAYVSTALEHAAY